MQLSAWYLWLKALHVAFMVTWFAGLFYLPRLFIYHTEAEDQVGRDRFGTMERRLFIIMTIGAVLTAVFGIALLFVNRALWAQGWFQLKLVFLAALIVYHVRCYHWIGRLKSGNLPQNTKWLRWFNELPSILLLVIVGLVVIKPH